MPLNHTAGERVEGMDELYRVVPVAKYQQQTRLTTTVKRMTGRQFRRSVNIEMPIFEAAWQHAQKAFANAGVSPGPMSIDILAQEYPRTDQICFVFCGMVRGQERFVTAPFQLTKAQIADLELRDLWQSQALVMH